MDELEQLQAQIAELQHKAEEIALQKKASVIEELKSKIKAYGVTAKDLGFTGKPSSKAGVSVAVKYRLHDNVWSGRGRKPKFVEDHIASGGKLEDLLV